MRILAVIVLYITARSAVLPVFAGNAVSLQPVIVFQPSHQTDTGKGFNEAATSGDIVDAALKSKPVYEEHKVWSYGRKGLHHADSGSNTKSEHTVAVVDGMISGCAWELERSNELKPLVFVSVHNNGGTGKHAVWGYVHDGDKYEAESRRLSNIIIEEVALATDLENRGTHLDSMAGMNDYRCRATGKLAFYSIDENVNPAPYRVLIEIGDIDASRTFLLNKDKRRAAGRAIKRGLERFFNSPGKITDR